MIIENDIKLDFKDVLIRPKRSNLNSRSEVELNRTFKFRHTNTYEWTGVPIMVANMDTVNILLELLKKSVEQVPWKQSLFDS